MKAEADIKIYRPHCTCESIRAFTADPCRHDTEEMLHIWRPACPAHREALEAARTFGMMSRI